MRRTPQLGLIDTEIRCPIICDTVSKADPFRMSAQTIWETAIVALTAPSSHCALAFPLSSDGSTFFHSTVRTYHSPTFTSLLTSVATVRTSTPSSCSALRQTKRQCANPQQHSKPFPPLLFGGNSWHAQPIDACPDKSPGQGGYEPFTESFDFTQNVPLDVSLTLQTLLHQRRMLAWLLCHCSIPQSQKRGSGMWKGGSIKADGVGWGGVESKVSGFVRLDKIGSNVVPHTTKPQYHDRWMDAAGWIHTA